MNRDKVEIVVRILAEIGYFNPANVELLTNDVIESMKKKRCPWATPMRQCILHLGHEENGHNLGPAKDDD